MIKTDEYNTTIKKILAMQAKWKLPAYNRTMEHGHIIYGNDINALIDQINAGKRKSGWGGATQGKINVGQIMKNIIANIATQADQITAHCPCNCNHCACNCNHCRCNCDFCHNCSSDCDSDCDNS